MKRHIQLTLIAAYLVYCTLVNCAEKLFISSNNNRYFIQPAAKHTWHDARRECEKRKMDMLTIETEEKSKEMKELLDKIFTGKHIPNFYLGATDYINFRNFSWVTPNGRVYFNYTNWEKSEPNNYKQLGERCVHIGFHGTDQWNDIRCSRKYGFICQERSDFSSLLSQVSKA